MPKLFTLSQKERLKSRKDIETLFQTGKAFLIYPFRVLYYFPPSAVEKGSLQFMVSVPKKNFRKATSRNRIRRQIKEVYRLQKEPLLQSLNKQERACHCAFIYIAKEALPFADLMTHAKRCISRLENIVESLNSELPRADA